MKGYIIQLNRLGYCKFVISPLTYYKNKGENKMNQKEFIKSIVAIAKEREIEVMGWD